MIEFPKQYENICKAFIRQFYSEQQRRLESGFAVSLPHPFAGTAAELEAKTVEGQPQPQVVLIFESAFAGQIAEIARAAAGELPDDEATRVVMEGIQDLVEQLFAPPGLTYHYKEPPEFWNETSFGRMVRDARLWVQQDRLITQREAAEILGVSLQAVNNAIRAGRLVGYTDSAAVNPRQGGVLVSRREVNEQ